jgi:hypothetical protein
MTGAKLPARRAAFPPQAIRGTTRGILTLFDQHVLYDSLPINLKTSFDLMLRKFTAGRGLRLLMLKMGPA